LLLQVKIYTKIKYKFAYLFLLIFTNKLEICLLQDSFSQMENKRTVRFADSPLPTPKGISAQSEISLSNNGDIVQETVEVKQIENQKDLGYKSLRNNYKV